MSKLSRFEIAVKTTGVVGLSSGVMAIVTTIMLLFEGLPQSKYLMVHGIAIGIFLCYLGFISLRYRQRETGLFIHEYEIME